MKPNNFRQPYSIEEERVILQFIIKEDGYNRVKGRQMWQEMEASSILNRTWQSMAEHFRKKLITKLYKFQDLNKGQRFKLLKGAGRFQEAKILASEQKSEEKVLSDFSESEDEPQAKQTKKNVPSKNAGNSQKPTWLKAAATEKALSDFTDSEEEMHRLQDKRHLSPTDKEENFRKRTKSTEVRCNTNTISSKLNDKKVDQDEISKGQLKSRSKTHKPLFEESEDEHQRLQDKRHLSPTDKQENFRKRTKSTEVRCNTNTISSKLNDKKVDQDEISKGQLKSRSKTHKPLFEESEDEHQEPRNKKQFPPDNQVESTPGCSKDILDADSQNDFISIRESPDLLRPLTETLPLSSEKKCDINFSGNFIQFIENNKISIYSDESLHKDSTGSKRIPTDQYLSLFFSNVVKSIMLQYASLVNEQIDTNSNPDILRPFDLNQVKSHFDSLSSLFTENLSETIFQKFCSFYQTEIKNIENSNSPVTVKNELNSSANMSDTDTILLGDIIAGKQNSDCIICSEKENSDIDDCDSSDLEIIRRKVLTSSRSCNLSSSDFENEHVLKKKKVDSPKKARLSTQENTKQLHRVSEESGSALISINSNIPVETRSGNGCKNYESEKIKRYDLDMISKRNACVDIQKKCGNEVVSKYFKSTNKNIQENPKKKLRCPLSDSELKYKDKNNSARLPITFNDSDFELVSNYKMLNTKKYLNKRLTPLNDWTESDSDSDATNFEYRRLIQKNIQNLNKLKQKILTLEYESDSDFSDNDYQQLVRIKRKMTLRKIEKYKILKQKLKIEDDDSEIQDIQTKILNSIHPMERKYYENKFGRKRKLKIIEKQKLETEKQNNNQITNIQNKINFKPITQQLEQVRVENELLSSSAQSNVAEISSTPVINLTDQSDTSVEFREIDKKLKSLMRCTQNEKGLDVIELSDCSSSYSGYCTVTKDKQNYNKYKIKTEVEKSKNIKNTSPLRPKRTENLDTKKHREKARNIENVEKYLKNLSPIKDKCKKRDRNNIYKEKHISGSDSIEKLNKISKNSLPRFKCSGKHTETKKARNIEYFEDRAQNSTLIEDKSKKKKLDIEDIISCSDSIEKFNEISKSNPIRSRETENLVTLKTKNSENNEKREKNSSLIQEKNDSIDSSIKEIISDSDSKIQKNNNKTVKENEASVSQKINPKENSKIVRSFISVSEQTKPEDVDKNENVSLVEKNIVTNEIETSDINELLVATSISVVNEDTNKRSINTDQSEKSIEILFSETSDNSSDIDFVARKTILKNKIKGRLSKYIETSDWSSSEESIGQQERISEEKTEKKTGKVCELSKNSLNASADNIEFESLNSINKNKDLKVNEDANVMSTNESSSSAEETDGKEVIEQTKNVRKRCRSFKRKGLKKRNHSETKEKINKEIENQDSNVEGVMIENNSRETTPSQIFSQCKVVLDKCDDIIKKHNEKINSDIEKFKNNIQNEESNDIYEFFDSEDDVPLAYRTDLQEKSSSSSSTREPIIKKKKSIFSYEDTTYKNSKRERSFFITINSDKNNFPSCIDITQKSDIYPEDMKKEVIDMESNSYENIQNYVTCDQTRNSPPKTPEFLSQNSNFHYQVASSNPENVNSVNLETTSLQIKTEDILETSQIINQNSDSTYHLSLTPISINTPIKVEEIYSETNTKSPRSTTELQNFEIFASKLSDSLNSVEQNTVTVHDLDQNTSGDIIVSNKQNTSLQSESNEQNQSVTKTRSQIESNLIGDKFSESPQLETCSHIEDNLTPEILKRSVTEFRRKMTEDIKNEEEYSIVEETDSEKVDETIKNNESYSKNMTYKCVENINLSKQTQDNKKELKCSACKSTSSQFLPNSSENIEMFELARLIQTKPQSAQHKKELKCSKCKSIKPPDSQFLPNSFENIEMSELTQLIQTGSRQDVRKRDLNSSTCKSLPSSSQLLPDSSKKTEQTRLLKTRSKSTDSMLSRSSNIVRNILTDFDVINEEPPTNSKTTKNNDEVLNVASQNTLLYSTHSLNQKTRKDTQKNAEIIYIKPTLEESSDQNRKKLVNYLKLALGKKLEPHSSQNISNKQSQNKGTKFKIIKLKNINKTNDINISSDKILEQSKTPEKIEGYSQDSAKKSLQIADKMKLICNKKLLSVKTDEQLLRNPKNLKSTVQKLSQLQEAKSSQSSEINTSGSLFSEEIDLTCTEDYNDQNPNEDVTKKSYIKDSELNLKSQSTQETKKGIEKYVITPDILKKLNLIPLVDLQIRVENKTKDVNKTIPSTSLFESSKRVTRSQSNGKICKIYKNKKSVKPSDILENLEPVCKQNVVYKVPENLDVVETEDEDSCNYDLQNNTCWAKVTEDVRLKSTIESKTNKINATSQSSSSSNTISPKINQKSEKNISKSQISKKIILKKIYTRSQRCLNKDTQSTKSTITDLDQPDSSVIEDPQFTSTQKNCESQISDSQSNTVFFTPNNFNESYVEFLNKPTSNERLKLNKLKSCQSIGTLNDKLSDLNQTKSSNSTSEDLFLSCSPKNTDSQIAHTNIPTLQSSPNNLLNDSNILTQCEKSQVDGAKDSESLTSQQDQFCTQGSAILPSGNTCIHD